MIEVIVQFNHLTDPDIERIRNINGLTELIRCKDCESRKKNKFCLKNMKYKDDYGYCDEAERKEE